MKYGVMAALLLGVGVAHAQNKAVEAQFWMDLATSAMSIPGMPDDMMESGMMSQMMGGNAFGSTKGPMGQMGKSLDTALWLRAKPAGIEGSHGIPAELRLGPTLPLLPPKVERARGERDSGPDEVPEKPKGRILFYWGCGENVRPGQPRVLDFAKADFAEYGRFMTGRHVADRGAKSQPGRSVWPNEKDRRRVPKDGSFVGGHALSGDGVPASFKFAVAEAYDFMPKIAMTTRGEPAASITVGWNAVSNAQAYFLNAMGARGESEMIIWSSSEEPDPGWGLMTYLSPANIQKFLKERVILPPATQQCVIPKGIFANVEGAMVSMIAYGPELNLSHPPRPPKAEPSWQPEWVARVRVKSTGMTMLGMGDEDTAPRSQRRSRSSREDMPTQVEREMPQNSGREEDGGGVGIPDAGQMLRGIFGR
ncbi:MAG: hypothetical protein KJ696_14580 [Gammaproteobacteria bacterium]|nr:hypothetical protein [Gammaproteobacteria bacterium]